LSPEKYDAAQKLQNEKEKVDVDIDIDHFSIAKGDFVLIIEFQF
jgi:hypothetical protein